MLQRLQDIRTGATPDRSYSTTKQMYTLTKLLIGQTASEGFERGGAREVTNMLRVLAAA